MITTEKWPVDVDTLEKGTVIPRERVEIMAGIHYGDPKWGLAVLRIIGTIERQLRDRGRPMTLYQRHGAIVCCTDEEARVYNPRQFDIGVSRMVRAHERNAHVDVRNLDESSRSAHDKTLTRHGRMLQALSKARRELKPQPVERSTPGLITGEIERSTPVTDESGGTVISPSIKTV